MLGGIHFHRTSILLYFKGLVMNNDKKIALIVGGTGVTGRAVIESLEKKEGWEIIALSRREPDFNTKAKFVSVDLLNDQDAENKLKHFDNITHYFYCGLSGGIEAENVEGNLKLLVNSLKNVNKYSKSLKRVVLTQGGKYYGVQIGPHKTPSVETDPRHMPPNFYYDQEDYVKELSSKSDWDYSLVRPEVMIGFSQNGGALTALSTFAIYACICAEMNVPFHYPGNVKSFEALNKYTDAEILGNFEVWVAENDKCKNEAFNITVGSVFSWSNIWDKIADYFDAKRGVVMRFSLTDFLSDKGYIWDRIVEKNDLQKLKMDQLASWPFADWIVGRDYHTMLDDTKRIQFGFTEVRTHEEAIFGFFKRLQKNNILP